MVYLKQVGYKLSNNNSQFISDFLNYLSLFGEVSKNEIVLQLSNKAFFPITSILFTEVNIPQVSFVFSDGRSVSTNITNTTNLSKRSPYLYSPIPLEEFIKRVGLFKLKGIDHTGFNLPYFKGIHPKILELRERVKKGCLYHTFPKHLEDAPWDFILPGSPEEISGEAEINYSLNRKPKIEIVSFEKSSTPLIQLDIQLEGSYEGRLKIFPEAIRVPEMRNLWVYIQNDYGIDVCFVLNEVSNKDWSYHFAKDRLF